MFSRESSATGHELLRKKKFRIPSKEKASHKASFMNWVGCANLAMFSKRLQLNK